MNSGIKVIDINLIGNTTGQPYNGSFQVKTLLSRREQFQADARRREIIGPNGESAMPALQGEAFMLGQLSARIVKAPDWWDRSSGGIDLKDDNVISTLFEEALRAEKEAIDEVKKQAEDSLKEIAEKKQ
jgi:hypothetical protein